ncbi:F-box protein CPR1-like [Cornus florida]|uniref:F-box protein CPR1-like n=1 Tax=Cornus florida TaxID=4283 RepID=UPI00289DD65A|nr:F-box protein CPR1-like [Cornus florida]
MAVLNLPEEIELDILSRLPVKSLLQFSLPLNPVDSALGNNNPNFTPQSIDYESLLDSNNKNENINVDNNALVELNCPLWSCQVGHKTYAFGSCNGLICYVVDAFKFILYNPSTRVCKELPEPPMTSPLSWIDCHYGFAFDSFDDDYKLVLGTNVSNSCESIRFHVFSLRHNSWRRIQDLSSGHLGTFTMCGYGIFVNGALHWLLIPAGAGSVQRPRVLVSLDLSKEASRTGVEMWLMKEYGVKASWSKFITIPILCDRGTFTEVTPLCFLRNRELLLNIYQRPHYFDQTSLASYSTTENSLTKICNCPYFSTAVLSVESLVPPSSFD